MASRGMDEKLPITPRIKMQVHLWACAWCMRYVKHLLYLRDTLREQTTQLTEDPSGPTLSPEARERIRRSL